MRPATEQLFEEFQPAFLANAEYRLRDQAVLADLGPRSPVAQVEPGTDGVCPKLSAFLGGLPLNRQPDDLEVRLKQLTDGTMRMANINHFEAVIVKMTDAMRNLPADTGPQRPSKSHLDGSWMESH